MLLSKTLHSRTFKLALTSIGAFGAIVLLLFTYVYVATIAHLRGRIDRGLQAEIAFLRSSYERSGREGVIAAIRERAGPESGHYYLLMDPSGDRAVGSVERWPSDIPLKGGPELILTQMPLPGTTRTASAQAIVETMPDGAHLLVAEDTADLDSFMRTIEIAFGSTLLLIFVLAGVASVSVTNRTMLRIDSINATSESIIRSGLASRIPLHGTGDEWDSVAQNLNLMLDRIQALMVEVKQATDNVAHDLRTPLTRMRGRLENASKRRRKAESDQTLIADTITELDSVLRVFSSLTRISQIEANDGVAVRRRIDLSEIARDVAELFEPAAEEWGTSLDVKGDHEAVILGDRDLLFDALANVVDNAIKHGGRGGRVTIEIVQRDGAVVVSVADRGPGIAASERAQVFRRFYRLEQSRHTPGNGLGLSLVAAVARLHGSRIELHDNAPGLKFEFWFQRDFVTESGGGMPGWIASQIERQPEN